MIMTRVGAGSVGWGGLKRWGSKRGGAGLGLVGEVGGRGW